MDIKIIYISLGFIAFDVLTGVLKGLKTTGLDSSVMREGLFHKAGEILAIVGAMLLTYATDYIKLGIDVPMVETVSAYICVMELLSSIENLSEISPDLYNLFEPWLKKLKTEGSDAEDDEINEIGEEVDTIDETSDTE